MNLTIQSPLVIKDLTTQSLAVVGEVVRQEEGQIEISSSLSLPIGAAVSIESDTYFLLGHVTARGCLCGEESDAKLSFLVQLDQCLNLATSHWREWTVPHSGGANQKQQPVLAK